MKKCGTCKLANGKSGQRGVYMHAPFCCAWELVLSTLDVVRLNMSYSLYHTSGGTGLTHNGEEYLTPAQACELLGVSRRTLERYAEHKKITKYRRGIRKNTFFKRKDVELLLDIHPDEPRG